MCRYIYALAHAFSGISHRNIDFDDLVSDGNFGLTDALQKYDRTKGPFRPYCNLRIRGEMLNGIRKRSGNSRAVHKALCFLRDLEEQRMREGKKFSAEEYVVYLSARGTPQRAINDLKEMNFKYVSMSSLDEKLDGLDESKRYSFLDTIVDLHQPLLSEEAVYNELEDILTDELVQCTYRERLFIVKYLEEKESIDEIGRKEGITASRVCQIIQGALRDPTRFKKVKEYLSINSHASFGRVLRQVRRVC